MNFDTPPSTPSAEREPHSPTLEEIQAQMQRLMNRGDYKEERRVEDDGNIKLYEVTIVGADGITCLYTYRKADGNRVPVTGIDVAYCNGSPNDNDFLPGGYNVSAYDEATGRWSDTEVIKKVEVPAVPTSTETIPAQPRATAPVVDGTNAQEVFNDLLKKEGCTALQKQFDEAESLYNTISPEETSLEIAKEARDKAKPLLNKIYARLVTLNKSASDNNMGISWNSNGDLTREQFDELNLRRMKLSNAVGMLHKDASGKIIIRHNLNEI